MFTDLIREVTINRFLGRMKSSPVYFQPSFMLIPNIPPYNPLEKAGTDQGLEREGLKKYPYTREETITTQGNVSLMILNV